MVEVEKKAQDIRDQWNKMEIKWGWRKLEADEQDEEVKKKRKEI